MFIVAALVLIAVLLSFGKVRYAFGSESLVAGLAVAAALSALLWTGLASA